MAVILSQGTEENSNAICSLSVLDICRAFPNDPYIDAAIPSDLNPDPAVLNELDIDSAIADEAFN